MAIGRLIEFVTSYIQPDFRPRIEVCSHQIEHHLFPDIPGHRYAEIAPEVRALCAKYGLPYNTGTMTKQFGTVVRRIFALALPPRRKAVAANAAQPALG